MAKLNSRVKAKQPIPPWKQLHHWQGLGLVLLMLPLGVSFILGSAALEQANRQGLPKAGWTDELAQDLGRQLSGSSIAKAVQWTSQSVETGRNQGLAAVFSRSSQVAAGGKSTPGQKPIALKGRQRRAVQSEIQTFSQQTHHSLDQAVAGQQNNVAVPIALHSASVSPIEASFPHAHRSLAPDLRRHHAPLAEGNQRNLPQPSPTDVANFLAIALGTEFSPQGQASEIPHIRKWTQNLRIQVHGQPTPGDIATLEQVVAEINDLLGDIELGFVESQPNLNIFFVAERDFSRYETHYQPVNHGFFWSEANQGDIQQGRILISTTDITQAERSHLIREELTQSLGLMQDSTADASSIFFQGWSQTQAYNPQDKQLLQLLYRPDIRPGMDAVAVHRVLLGG